MNPIRISVVICTHNPERSNLAQTLAGLAAQDLNHDHWETILVDNASSPPLALPLASCPPPPNLRLVVESQLGLTTARRRGLQESQGALLVLVDDDNILAPDFLTQAYNIFSTHPKLGVVGGPIAAKFTQPPETWVEEFFPLLALRDLGPDTIISVLQTDPATGLPLYPAHAPVGAGMVLRTEVAAIWLQQPTVPQLSDRQGGSLSSGGDNDIVFTALKSDWEIGYSPQLHVQHLIPAARCQPQYLARLNHGIQCSWVQLLAHHQACPWTPITPLSVPFRQARAWWRERAWRGPVEHIRWRGLCGHFAGRAKLPSPR